jgi:signal transduction histidine kinase
MRIHSLTARILLTLLLSTSVPFFAFGWYASRETEKRLESQVVKVYLPELAANAAEKIRSRLESIEHGCDVLYNAARWVLQDGSEPAVFGEAVDFTRAINNTLDLVLLIDGAGRIVPPPYPNPGLDPKTKAARDALLPESVAETPWFSGIASGREGIVWLDRHLSPFLHRTVEKVSLSPTDYSLALVLAVQTDTPAQGAVFALIRWSEVQRVLDDTQRFLREEAGFGSAEVFLCRDDGAYLAHTDRELYGAAMGEDLIDALRRIDEKGEAPFADASGVERRAGFARVGHGAFRDWWIGLHAERRELFDASEELRMLLLGVTVASVLILVAWGLVASRAIVRPVRRLADATERIAQGDLSTRVVAKGQHELADLGRSFNRMAEDLTHSREQLRQAERQSAWAEMARQVAHEIKNPLTPMRMTAQLVLKAKKDNDPRLGELIDRLARGVLDQTSALARIAADFQQFAGPPTREVETLAADHLLAEVAELFAATSETGGVAVRFEPGAPGASIDADRQEMRRVFLNLIQNGIAACNDRGTVTVRSACEDGRVVFRITDDGSGIPARVQQRLFEPYFTTKSSGTGLGLAICKRILQAHGGSIALESSRPGETTFRFEVPVVAAR